MTDAPTYSSLPDGSAWGCFGSDDVLGTLNRQTPATIARASKLVVTGTMFSLNGPLNWPNPPLFNRRPLEHTVYRTDLGNRDDYLDSFYPQVSSQWDGFQHFKDPELGFYNGLEPERLGVDAWARRGIAGRAVLLDAGRFFATEGRALDWRSDTQITVDELEAIRLASGVDKQPGDIVLLRTGWVAAYNAASAEERLALRSDLRCPGLAHDKSIAEYLWDWGASAVAGDNIGLEAMPTRSYGLHAHLLGRLGMPIGELWWLDDLAEHSARDGRFESFLTSAPLNVPGGVGSTANAIAFK